MLLRRLVPMLVAAAVVAGPASAQLIPEELVLLPETLTGGTGTVRLDGMGGFLISVQDENNEINLWDYVANPAGFSDDKDSWAVDIRYSHREITERDQVYTYGDDIRQNLGTFLMGYHAPRRLGVGGSLDYGEAQNRKFVGETNDYRVVGFSLTGNLYVLRNLSAGVNFSSTGLDKDVFTSDVYSISHSGSSFRSSLGLAYHLMEGITLGARGDYVIQSVDGLSQSSRHTDQFTWDRPGYLGSLHFFVNRGRVDGVVDYTAQTLEGAEEVNISWSERFIFNPGPTQITGQLDTFSEDRENSVFSTRWMLHVVPRTLSVSVAAAGSDYKTTVIQNPNAVGSLPRSNREGDGRAFIGGLTFTGLENRLLLAGEVASVERNQEDNTGVPSLRNELRQLSLRAGSEYMIGESFAGRLGFVHRRNTMKFLSRDDLATSFRETSSQDYNSSVVTVGVGVVPTGAIWQLDFAYDVVVQSDLDTDDERFSAYVRYLF